MEPESIHNLYDQWLEFWAPKDGPLRIPRARHFNDKDFFLNFYFDIHSQSVARQTLINLRDQLVGNNEYFVDAKSLSEASNLSENNFADLMSFVKSNEGKEFSKACLFKLDEAFTEYKDSNYKNHFFPILAAANEVRMNMELARILELKDNDAWNAYQGGIWFASVGLRTMLVHAEFFQPDFVAGFERILYSQIMSLRVRTDLEIRERNLSFFITNIASEIHDRSVKLIEEKKRNR